MKSYSYQDILRALGELGIQKGDSVYLSTSLGVIGSPPEGIKSTRDLCKLFFDAIMETIGEDGTLYVPCFSYSFGKSSASSPAVFDPQNTKPEIGAFPEFIHSLPNKKASIDPMLSVCVVGKDYDLIELDKQCSYCEGGFLSKLAKSNIKLLNIGIGPNWMPFIHYVDWLLRVDYRYGKVFNGVLRYDNYNLNMPWLYHVRALIENSNPDDSVGYDALKEGIYKKAKLGNIYIYSCIAKDYFDYVLERAKKEPWLLAKGPMVDVLEEEKRRTGIEVYTKQRLQSEEDLVKKAITLPRDIVSDSLDEFLDDLQTFYNFKNSCLYEWKSGEEVGPYIVPERWIVKDYLLSFGERVLFSKKEGLHNRIFRYSLNIDAVVHEDELRRHLHLSAFGLKHISVWNNRDWGFVLKPEEFNTVENKREFRVYIESDFSLGTLKLLEKSYNFKDSYKRIALVGLMEGPYRIDEHISACIVLGGLNKNIIEGSIKPVYNLTILLSSSVVGVLKWLFDLEDKPDFVLFVKFLGNNLNFSFITNNRKSIRYPSYLMSEEFFFGVGNNPVLDKVAYPSIDMAVLLRGYQPFSHNFPQPYSGLDTDKSVDFNAIKESYEFIKHILEEGIIHGR